MVTEPRRIPKSKMLWQVIIDRELQRAFRVQCAKEGVSMSKKASELIARCLKETRTAAYAGRMRRTSRNVG